MAYTDQKLFTPFPSVFGALVIGDTIDADPSAGITQIVGRAAGSRHVLARGLAFAEPRVNVSCLNLTHLSASGMSIVDGMTLTDPSKIQFQKRAFGGTFDSTGHVVLSASRGKLVPESISTSQDSADAAMLNFAFYPLYDGTNPIVQIAEAALQGSPAISAMYKLGPVSVGGSKLGGVQSVQVQFGINVQPVRSDGETVARDCRLGDLDPSINIEAKNLAYLVEQIGLGLGSNVTVVAYFAKVGVAPNVAEHVSVTCAGTIEVGNIAARRSDDVQPGLIARPVGALSINTATTIPI